ncbi:MAG: DNA-binding transcriptional response regulator, NtrC family [Chloroflexi bacterium AL-W]|nr:DNA-binding transcriptional response regulator, NtrC family [Chloroflexi bacterium AL-N1]NOK66581.1 DNA-binding transcriptional response regulator, NtrC family [Chloroflexi bacterium AL-N10]NOK71969.1 DNA-binding transcriptional response regulator, NtrC family [Chloroflexi bacterium AL-N5]NOK81226.1 DNA-binding transcriptional response regulator, NtrC family [Chloroflexi bacterium AL-W]NOK89499.1 DNA-binding transcriptional response regulator, NtrC family [Chloroflexi bacterium AL-N15]
MSHITILIVDDSPNVRTLMRRLLTSVGYHVVEAADGYEAIRFARQHRPNVILMDLGLPGMDGWEVTRRLRTEPALEDIPIIAVTGYDVSTVAQTARRAGCQKVLFKPFNFDNLRRQIAVFADATVTPSRTCS